MLMVTYAGCCQSSSVNELRVALLEAGNIPLESGVGVWVAVAEVYLFLEIHEHVREGEGVVAV